MTRRILLASDLDGTLLPPSGVEPERNALRDFRELRAHVLLAYMTGRHLELARAGVAEGGLPEPDVFVCDVGTSLYERAGDSWSRSEAYRARMHSGFGIRSTEEIRTRLLTVEGLREQEPWRQGEFKLSFFAPTGSGLRRCGDRAREILDDLGVAADVVDSEDPRGQIGLLDVLPRGASKASALHYLREQHGLDWDQILFCGDSGNDRAALLTPAWGIVVGNAPEDLKRELREAARLAGGEDRLYLSRGDYVAGVVEGVRSLGVL